MTKRGLLTLAALATIGLAMLAACGKKGPQAGEVLDEARTVGRTADTLKGADDDYMAAMDKGVTLNPDLVYERLSPYVPGATKEALVQAVVRGRNNWNVWTGGNDRFWDEIGKLAFGNLDLLKTLSSHPELGYGRHNRWEWLGLVNEPCFSEYQPPAGCNIDEDPMGCGNPDNYGLWLDVRDASCAADPYENEEKYPGVAIGARGDNVPVGSYYGYASGILGLRLFPNPDFDAAAEAAWDPKAFYNDPDYYNDDQLVRPYRVGMSCGFCHIGPDPSNPPEDPENPKWENLNSNPGAQYFWIDRIFVWNSWYGREDDNFIYQLFHTSRPGALDTSLVSSDNINNPRTMNAVYSLGARAAIALKWGKESLGPDGAGSRNNAEFNDYSPERLPADSPLSAFYEAPNTVYTPRVLKDGADSVGVLGALNRVFVNIGLFSEEWLLHFKPLIGGPNITPFPIAAARQNSAYWNATEEQTLDTALFFLATAEPDYLKDAPGGAEMVLAEDDPQMARGKEVFAETCARCHSSKLPEKAFTDFFPDHGCVNENYLDCWDDYWQWTKTDEFKTAMREIVADPDFRQDNFLSNDLRIPVTLLETNACSPLATNGLRGDIWDNFTSESYKNLPAVGSVLVHDPFTGEASEFEMPGGGRGYTRPPSLISVWSTAPYLLNNALGKFEWTGSVEGRMASFNDSIEKLLWPEKREGSREYVTRSGKMAPGHIDRTTAPSYLRIASGFLPEFLRPLEGVLARFLPWLFGGGGVEIGPIPKGTPVNLLGNLDSTGEMGTTKDLLELVIRLKRNLKQQPTEAEAAEVFSDLIGPLMKLNRCPDFIVNRGHYFGTDYLPAEEGETPLSDDDKRALIEFLKTL